MKCSRRQFIAGAAAFGGKGVFRVAAGTGVAGTPKLKLGIVSDIHISFITAERWDAIDLKDFRKALLFFRQAGVDAVAIPGDLASLGLRCELESMAAVWYEVFPDDRLPDGRKVEKLFVTGNHDWDGHVCAKKEIAEKYPDPEIRNANYLSTDYARHWESCFHEPFAPVWMKRVKGYAFVGAHWFGWKATPAGGHINDFIKPFFDAHADELKGEKPFFFIQHPHPKDTCYGPRAWGHDDGTSTAALSPFPNAVALTGHSHYALTEESSIWQGSFTSIGCGSLACTEIPLAQMPEGDENGETPKGNAQAKMMPQIVPGRGVQGMVMSVCDDRLVIERRRFDEDAALGPDWVVPFGTVLDRPFSFANRRGTLAVPEFSDSAAVTLTRVVAKNRGGGEKPSVVVDFPPATGGGVRAFRYQVAAFSAVGREWKRKTVIAADFSRAQNPSAKNACVFASDELPEGTIRFAVCPCNYWGRAGQPIHGAI